MSDEDVDDDDDDADDFSMPPLPSDLGDPVADPLVPITSQSVPVADRSFTITRPAQIPFDWHDFETSKLLYKFYGFVTPLPLPSLPSSISVSKHALLSTVIGLTRSDSNFFTSPAVSSAIEFLGCLNTLKTPKNASWDIVSGNRMSN